MEEKNLRVPEKQAVLVINPQLKVPEKWKPISGSTISRKNGHVEERSWYLLRKEKGKFESFEEAIKNLSLHALDGPDGSFWFNGNTDPVAFTKKNQNSSWNIVLGDWDFFDGQGMAILQQIFLQYKSLDRVFYSCSNDIVCSGLPIDRLHSDHWYPIESNPHVIIWGTGLYLYPKNFEWKIGLEKKLNRNGKGTKIYDYSPNRMQLLCRFFKEAFGYEVIDPVKEYFFQANQSDPRCGKWTCRQHYPGKWKPNFPGWRISNFSGLECRWKQPKEGSPRFYGLLR